MAAAFAAQPTGASDIARMQPSSTAPPIDVRVLPRPLHVAVEPSCSFQRSAGLSTARNIDAGAREIVDERWRALGLPALRDTSRHADLSITFRAGAAQSYRLDVSASSIVIEAADGDGAFYALTTLAQLAQRGGAGVRIACVHIVDVPALRWRILSDDVSRGPLPTMRYFRERIRTIAAFKMNGYSPYMEHVFADPKHPLPAPHDGITPAHLHELAAYARRFHVALIPEQQTFAHMHNTLRWEEYAHAAELPHGYLLSPAVPLGAEYVADLVGDELAAVPHPPFFHIGSDEPSDLGRGVSRTLVNDEGIDRAYTDHVLATVALLGASGARPMIWDDAVQAHPAIFAALPKSLVFINWHYGSEQTFMPYIERIANAGFDQMVAPGADNWNEIYPNLDVALGNIDRFVSQGKAAHVLGLFQTVWHDDGETLYEATWYPVVYAAASAWEAARVDRERYARDFPRAFFGTDDPRYVDDFKNMADARTLLEHALGDRSGNYLFWADPFDAAFAKNLATPTPDVANVRLAVERTIAHLRSASAPPLHQNAAAVLAFAANKYDVLGRNLQIASEARAYYDDARSNAGKNDDYVGRGLNVAKYLLWEMRDEFEELEPMARATWEYESRTGHEASVLERYHLAAQRAIERADALNRVAVETYAQTRTLPPFDDVIRASGSAP